MGKKNKVIGWVSVFICAIVVASNSMANELNLPSRVPTKGVHHPPSAMERDRFLTASMASLGAAGILHLMADSSYQRYDEARDKATAEKERERTELLDKSRNVLIGIAGVCVALFEYRSYTGAREKAPKMSLKPMIQIDKRPSLCWKWIW
ncbi:MAG: hypothetical protein AB1797_13590 [bacterium]